MVKNVPEDLPDTHTELTLTDDSRDTSRTSVENMTHNNTCQIKNNDILHSTVLMMSSIPQSEKEHMLCSSLLMSPTLNHLGLLKWM